MLLLVPMLICCQQVSSCPCTDKAALTAQCGIVQDIQPSADLVLLHPLHLRHTSCRAFWSHNPHTTRVQRQVTHHTSHSATSRHFPARQRCTRWLQAFALRTCCAPANGGASQPTCHRVSLFRRNSSCTIKTSKQQKSNCCT